MRVAEDVVLHHGGDQDRLAELEPHPHQHHAEPADQQHDVGAGRTWRAGGSAGRRRPCRARPRPRAPKRRGPIGPDRPRRGDRPPTTTASLRRDAELGPGAGCGRARRTAPRRRAARRGCRARRSGPGRARGSGRRPLIAATRCEISTAVAAGHHGAQVAEDQLLGLGVDRRQRVIEARSSRGHRGERARAERDALGAGRRDKRDGRARRRSCPGPSGITARVAGQAGCRGRRGDLGLAAQIDGRGDRAGALELPGARRRDRGSRRRSPWRRLSADRGSRTGNASWGA